FQGFETKNGPVIIAAANDRLFAKLAVALGRPDWATDPRFTTNALRQEHKAALVPEIETIMLTRTKGEWVDLLEEAGVPCAPIHTFLEVLAHPQTAATGMIQKVPQLDPASLIQYLKPVVLGQDPLERERLYQAMSQRSRATTLRAIGAMDVALWDIAGKIAALPIHRLLGSYRDRVPAYASSAVLGS